MGECLQEAVKLGELAGAVDEARLEWDQHTGHFIAATVANPIMIR